MVVGMLAGWFLRRWWDRRKRPKPDGEYEGLVVLSDRVAGPMRSEARISEPDEDGRREVLEYGVQVAQRIEWQASFKDRERGGLLLRFQGNNAAREMFEDGRVGDKYRIEFYRVGHETKRQGDPPLAPWYHNPTKTPFGQMPGGDGVS